MKTIDLTPTPDEYRNTLMFVIQNAVSKESCLWAKAELKRIENVVEWGPQPSINTDSSVL